MTARPDLEDIFSEAIAIESDEERAHYLMRACGKDLGMRAQVEALIEANSEAEGFLADITCHHGGATQYLTGSPASSTSNQLELLDSEIGPYKLRELIGEGGMGVVYLAEQERPLRRRVALKVIKLGMDSKQVVARFEAERQALAMMDHPHIARVFDGGVTPSGHPYFAMELVQGLAITTYCNRRQLSVEERLALFIDVCHAVEHSHSKQIIHRDLKPSNVMITHCDGRALAKVIDFGIARAIGNTKLTDKTLFTAYSMFMGTPAYMSPEQAAFSAVDVDARSDVYSLGVLLYELLTGTSPLESSQISHASYDEVRRLICDVEPSPPSVRISTVRSASASTLSATDIAEPLHPYFKLSIPSELDWIVMKALEKDRSRRYQSAAGLAADLQSFLRGEPVSAGPRTKFYRLSKLAKRHQAKLVASLIMIGVLSILTFSWNRTLLSRHRAATAEIQQQRIARQLEDVQFAQAMQRASSALEHGLTENARKELLPWAQSSSRQRHRFELNFLLRRLSEPLSTLRLHQYDLLDVDVSADQRWLASSDRGGDIVLCDGRSGREAGRFHPSDGEVTRVRFSPDGTLLASVGVDTQLRIWQPAEQKELVALAGHKHTINGLDWSADGRLLATGDRAGVVRIWDPHAQTCRHILPQHAGVVRCLAWSPDGKWLATADGNAAVKIWETANWTEVKTIDSQENATLAIAFSDDSNYLAFGGYGNKLVIVEVTSFEVQQSVELASPIQSITFGNRRALFVGLSDGTFEVLNFDGPDAVWEHSRRISDSNEGKQKIRALIPNAALNVLWVGSEEGRTVRSYSLVELLGGQEIPTPSLPVGRVAESNRIVVTNSLGNRGTLQHVDSGAIQLSFTEHINRWCLPQFVPSRDLMLISFDQPHNIVKVIRRSDGLLLQELAFPGHLHTLSVSRDGLFVVGAGWEGKVRVWNLSTFDATDLMEGSGPNGARAQFSPHEDILILGQGATRQLSLLKTGTWEPIRQVHTGDAWYTFMFFHTANRLVVSGNGRASLWDGNLAESKWSTAVAEGRVEKFEHLALTLDESAIFGYSSQSTLKAWDAMTGNELFAWDLPGGDCRWLNFTDEQTLYIDGTDGSLVLDNR